MTLPVCCSTVVLTGLNKAFISLSRYIANLHTISITRVDEANDIMSVNTVLQQCTGKTVRLNIQFELTCSTTVIECNIAMALVVLMEQYNFISAGKTLQKQRGISLYRQFIKGFRTYIT